MVHTHKLLVGLLATSLVMAPLRANHDAQETVEIVVEKPVVKRSQPSVIKNALSITSGLLCLAGAYALYPQALKAYNHFNIINSNFNKGFAKFAGNFIGKKESQALLQEQLYKAGGEAVGYAAGTAALAGIGLALVAHGLTLTK